MQLASAEWAMIDYRDKLLLDQHAVAILAGHQRVASPEPPDVELRELQSSTSRPPFSSMRRVRTHHPGHRSSRSRTRA